MKKLVYICSPCRGDYEKNIDNAATYSRAAFRKGYIPITPHLYFTRFMDDTNDKERSMAMDAGLQLLLMCSEVWVFGLDHPSEGMQAEIALAIRHGIPIIDGDEILSGKKKPAFKLVQRIQADEVNAGGSADIHMHPSGQWLYTSHRLENDGISIFKVLKDGKLEKIGYANTGRHPRNFMITPDGKLLTYPALWQKKLKVANGKKAN